MSDWPRVAQRLRTVREAHEEFLVRDFVEHFIIGPMLLDRIARDLCAVTPAIRWLPVQRNTPNADDN